MTTSANFLIELFAALFTLAGMFIGSTSLIGALCYGASLFFWFPLMWRKRLWGLLPLNIATLGVCGLNLVRALP